MEHEPDDDRPMLRSTRLPPATTAALRSSLDDHQTRAQELREALDQLRTDLDEKPPRATSRRRPWPRSAAVVAAPREAGTPAEPKPPLRVRAGRFALVAGAAVVMLLAATAVVRIVAWSLAGATGLSAATSPAASQAPATAAPPAARTAGPAATTPPAATSSAPAQAPPTASASPTRPARPGRTAIVRFRGLPGAGPGVDEPGSELTAVVAGRGAVDVYERLVVRPGTTSVRLSVVPSTALPRGLRGVRVAVRGLQVDVDGRPVRPRTARWGWRVTPPGGTPFTHVVVRYRLTGALVRADPAPPGRVMLVLRPLTGPTATAASDPVVVRLYDRRVGQVYCPGAANPLCAVARGARHVATVPAGARPVVIAQVTLR